MQRQNKSTTKTRQNKSTTKIIQNKSTRKALQDITNIKCYNATSSGKENIKRYNATSSNKENIRPCNSSRIPLQDITIYKDGDSLRCDSDKSPTKKSKKLSDEKMTTYIKAFYLLPLQNGKTQRISKFLDMNGIRKNENAFRTAWRQSGLGEMKKANYSCSVAMRAYAEWSESRKKKFSQTRCKNLGAHLKQKNHNRSMNTNENKIKDESKSENKNEDEIQNLSSSGYCIEGGRNSSVNDIVRSVNTNEKGRDNEDENKNEDKIHNLSSGECIEGGGIVMLMILLH